MGTLKKSSVVIIFQSVSLVRTSTHTISVTFDFRSIDRQAAGSVKKHNRQNVKKSLVKILYVTATGFEPTTT